jgi:hypothetical protein
MPTPQEIDQAEGLGLTEADLIDMEKKRQEFEDAKPARMAQMIADGEERQRKNEQNPFYRPTFRNVEPKKKHVQHEAKPTREIIDYIKLIGGFAYRQNTMGTPIRDAYGSVSGMRPADIRGGSDIIGILPAKYGSVMLAIEVKSETGKPTEDQVWYLGEVAKRGGFAMVARSVGEVVDKLEKWKKLG